MSVERRNKAESPVVIKGRSSIAANGGIMPILVRRVRQPLMAKEPLCGNQPTNLSLVIAVLSFPSFSVFLLINPVLLQKEGKIGNKY